MSATEPRYRAFISYSHRDAVITRRLHRRLETYAVPRSLTRDDAAPLPTRLHPVFLDRDELASSGTLSHSIQAALDDSAALVVVCSPAAASSAWVDAEIAWFRRHHPQRPLFAFVVAGDPGLDPRREPARAALPLRLMLLDPSRDDGDLGEPLAADARPEADGFTSAFFKLAAGLLGVRYDDLRQRDHRRRQRRSLLLSGVALLLAVVFAWLAWDATRARDAARAAQAVAELELTSERQTREFLLSVFHLADATEARGERVTVREALDRAVERIDHTRFDRPAIRARFLATMGQAYSSLGLNRRGSQLLRQSIQGLTDATSVQDREQRRDSRIELAETLFDMGEYAPALTELDLAQPDLAGEAPLARARAAAVRGEVLAYLERDDEARDAYRDALAAIEPLRDEVAGVAVARARSLSGLALLDLFADDAAAARRGFGDALTLLQRSVGADHPNAIAAAISLGSAAYREGARDEARQAWEGALAQARRVYDPDGPAIGTLKNNLGLLLFEDGELDAAEPLLRDALDSDRRHRSDNFDDLAYPLHNLGYLMLVQGRLDEAATLLQEALPIAEASRHRMLGPILNALADLHCVHDDIEAGRALAQRAVERLAQADAPDAWRAQQARLTLDYCTARAGLTPDRRAREAAFAALRQRWTEASPFVRRARAQLAASR